MVEWASRERWGKPTFLVTRHVMLRGAGTGVRGVGHILRKAAGGSAGTIEPLLDRIAESLWMGTAP